MGEIAPLDLADLNRASGKRKGPGLSVGPNAVPASRRQECGKGGITGALGEGAFEKVSFGLTCYFRGPCPVFRAPPEPTLWSPQPHRIRGPMPMPGPMPRPHAAPRPMQALV